MMNGGNKEVRVTGTAAVVVFGFGWLLTAALLVGALVGMFVHPYLGVGCLLGAGLVFFTTIFLLLV